MSQARAKGIVKGLVSRLPPPIGPSRVEPPKNESNNNEIIRNAIPVDRYHDTQRFKVDTLTKEKLAKDDIIVVLMGPTGSGKSTFLGTAAGLDGWAGHGLQSHTSEVQAVRVSFEDSVHVVLVDTPGFDDTYKSDVEILELTSDWLKKTYESDLHLSGILYFHRISDNRMAGAPLKNLKIFEKLCGENAFQKVVFVTTMWQDVEASVGNRRERELTEEHWATMMGGGSKTIRFEEPTRSSAWETLNNIITLEFDTRALQIQKELVDLNKDLPRTLAGQQLYRLIEHWIGQQTEVLKQLKEVSKTEDGEIMREFATTLKELRERRATAVVQMRQLDSSLVGRVRRLFAF